MRFVSWPPQFVLELLIRMDFHCSIAGSPHMARYGMNRHQSHRLDAHELRLECPHAQRSAVS